MTARAIEMGRREGLGQPLLDNPSPQTGEISGRSVCRICHMDNFGFFVTVGTIGLIILLAAGVAALMCEMEGGFTCKNEAYLAFKIVAIAGSAIAVVGALGMGRLCFKTLDSDD